MDQMGLLWSRGVHGGEAESLFRKGSSRLVAAIAECLHTANIRRFSQLRRERCLSPHTRRFSQLRSVKLLACLLDTSHERSIDQQPGLHQREDPAHLYSCSLFAMTSLRNPGRQRTRFPTLTLVFSKRYTDCGKSYWRSMKEGRFPHESFWPHNGLPHHARSHQSPVRTGV